MLRVGGELGKTNMRFFTSLSLLYLVVVLHRYLIVEASL